jgi:phospholipid/cholesterol/gamma-HCH transport system substrate-binding protein
MSKQTMHVRVGLFVLLALGVLIVTVFVLGQQSSMFTSKTRLYTSFKDINGLIVGAPVRLAGIDVGRVTAISFSDDLSRADARVELAIEDDYMERVRQDSRAFIDSKGLLGDKIVNISVGSPRSPQLKEGQYVQPGEGVSFEGLAKQVESTAAAIGNAATEAQGAVSNLASPEITDNLRRITGSLASILEAVERGDGLAHQMLYDPAYAERTSTILNNLAATSARARNASGRIDEILAQIETGPGTLNALVYGEDGAAALAELRRAASGVAEVTDHLNNGPGLAHTLLRDPAGRELMHDFAEFADRLNRISIDIERGRGTLGALIVDPSVYEDLKKVLGNIERNVLFKALIRMTIKNDGIQRPAMEPEPLDPFKKEDP